MELPNCPKCNSQPEEMKKGDELYFICGTKTKNCNSTIIDEGKECLRNQLKQVKTHSSVVVDKSIYDALDEEVEKAIDSIDEGDTKPLGDSELHRKLKSLMDARDELEKENDRLKDKVRAEEEACEQQANAMWRWHSRARELYEQIIKYKYITPAVTKDGKFIELGEWYYDPLIKDVTKQKACGVFEDGNGDWQVIVTVDNNDGPTHWEKANSLYHNRDEALKELNIYDDHPYKYFKSRRLSSNGFIWCTDGNEVWVTHKRHRKWLTSSVPVNEIMQDESRFYEVPYTDITIQSIIKG